MIDGTYKFDVDVPFGRKQGTIVLRSEGDVAYADVDAPIVGKRHMEGRVEGNTFTAQGSSKIKLMGNIEFALTGEVSGDNLHIDIKSSKGEMTLEGTRV